MSECTKGFENTPRSVLCIAYFFPPMSTGGVHRTRAVVRHLPAFGWCPVVLTAQDNSFPVDPELLKGLPKRLDVYPTKAPSLLSLALAVRSRLRNLMSFSTANGNGGSIPSKNVSGGSQKIERSLTDWVSWWLQVPDSYAGWLPGALVTAVQAVYRHRCEAIYTTAPFFTTHLIGLLAKKLTRRRWIADFRDPWRGNPMHNFPYKDVDGFDAWLERQVIKNADWVICNTEPARRDFCRRYPARRDRFVTVLNGYEPEDFVDLQPRRIAQPDSFVVSHTGEFYGLRRPDNIFQALQLLRDRKQLPEKFCLQLIGLPQCNGTPLESIASQYGVEKYVAVTGIVSHRAAQTMLVGSDVLLLVGFGGKGSEFQVPGKLYEYIGAKRPILALASQRSAIAQVLADGKVNSKVCEPNNSEQIAKALHELIETSSNKNSLSLQNDPSENVTQFTRKTQVGHIARLLAAIPKKSNLARN